MHFLSTNNATGTLAEEIDQSATTITLLAGQGDLFPIPIFGNQFSLTLSQSSLKEIVYVTARVGDVFTVIRAQEGTTAQVWDVGTTAQNLFTSGQFDNVLQFEDTVYTPGLFVDAATFNIPSYLNIIATSGFYVEGVGSAFYKATDTLPPFNGGFSASGRFWKIVDNAGFLITQFGALPDSNLSFAPGADLNNPASFVPVTGTDNSPAINNALSYVASLSSGGKVGVPSGVFGCNAALFPKSRTKFQGLGGWVVKLDNGPVYHFIQVNDSDNVELTGLNVDGNRHGNDSTNTGHNIRTHNSQNVNVSFCQTYNSCGYGVSSDLDIANITYAFNGIFNAGADGIDMHNTSVENNSSQIIGNIIDGFGNKGVPKAGIHGRGQGLIIIGNVVKDCGSIIGGITGIGCGNGETIYGQRVIGNYVEMGTRCTLAKGIGTNNPGGVVIGNHVAGDIGTLTGYSFNGIDQIIQGNLLSPAPGSTISCVRDGYAYGVTVLRALSSGNTAIACGQDGFSDLGTDNRFSANSAVDCPGYAYNMVGSTGALLDSLNVENNCTLGLLNRGTGTLFNQITDIFSSPTFKSVTLPTFPVAGTDAANRAWVESFVTGHFVSYNIGAPITVPNTTNEYFLVTIPIIGGSIGPNGSFEIFTMWDFVATTTLQLRIKFGQFPMFNVQWLGLSITTFTIRSIRIATNFGNAGNETTQIGWVGNNVSYGFSGSPCITGAIDTTVDQNLVITATKSTALDICILRRATVLFVPGTT